MPNVDWNRNKAEALRARYGVSFEDVVTQIEQGNALDIPHHNAERYPNQRLFIVAIENYAYVVPYVEDNDVVFLKTLYPSRKAVRDYFPLLGGDYDNAQSGS